MVHLYLCSQESCQKVSHRGNMKLFQSNFQEMVRIGGRNIVMENVCFYQCAFVTHSILTCSYQVDTIFTFFSILFDFHCNFSLCFFPDLKYSNIGPIYYEFGSLVITYINGEKAVKAFGRLQEASYDDKQLLVLLLPNIQVRCQFQ